jgi:hypothetical protein
VDFFERLRAEQLAVMARMFERMSEGHSLPEDEAKQLFAFMAGLPGRFSLHQCGRQLPGAPAKELTVVSLARDVGFGFGEVAHDLLALGPSSRFVSPTPVLALGAEARFQSR